MQWLDWDEPGNQCRLVEESCDANHEGQFHNCFHGGEHEAILQQLKIKYTRQQQRHYCRIQKIDQEQHCLGNKAGIVFCFARPANPLLDKCSPRHCRFGNYNSIFRKTIGNPTRKSLVNLFHQQHVISGSNMIDSFKAPDLQKSFFGIEQVGAIAHVQVLATHTCRSNPLQGHEIQRLEAV